MRLVAIAELRAGSLFKLESAVIQIPYAPCKFGQQLCLHTLPAAHSVDHVRAIRCNGILEVGE